MIRPVGFLKDVGHQIYLLICTPSANKSKIDMRAEAAYTGALEDAKNNAESTKILTQHPNRIKRQLRADIVREVRQSNPTEGGDLRQAGIDLACMESLSGLKISEDSIEFDDKNLGKPSLEACLGYFEDQSWIHYCKNEKLKNWFLKLNRV